MEVSRLALAKGFGVKGTEVVIFYSEGDLDRFAAYLAVFDVGLAANRQIEDHRNLFTAIWTGEFVFH